MKTGKKGKFLLVLITSVLMMICIFVSVSAAERRIVRVGYPVQNGFTMKEENGGYYGYTYEYLQELSQYTQWKYEFVEVEGELNDSFPIMMDMLARGEIDMLGSMVYNEALGKLYDYPAGSYGETGIVLTVNDDNRELTPSSFMKKEILKVAVIGEGGKQQQALIQYLNSIGQQYELIHCENGMQTEGALERGQADAILETEVGIGEEDRVVARFSSTPFYFAVTKGNKEILKELNSGMIELQDSDPALVSRLHHKYFNNISRYLLFEEEENEYLKQADVITVGVLDGKAPVQSINRKTGEAEGIAVSFLDYISSKTGLRFEYINVRDTDSYIALIRDKKVDLILAIPGGAVAEQLGIIRTLPYMKVSQILILHKGVEPGNLKGKTEAVYDAFGSPDEEAGEVKLYYSPEEAMEAVNTGEADYCRINNYSYQYCINKRVYKNITAIVSTGNDGLAMSMGVVDDSDLPLHSIMNKVIVYMPEIEKKNIFYESSVSQENTSFIEYIKTNPAPFITAALFLAAVIAVILFHGVRRQYEMNRKMALEYQRYSQLSEMVGESVYEYKFQEDTLRFFGDGAEKLGVSKEISDFSSFGKRRLEAIGISDDESLYQWIMEKKDGGKDVQIRFAIEPERWYRVTSKVVKDDIGRPVYAIGRIWDIQDEKIEKDRLLEKAQNDGMTGIYNSVTVREMIRKELGKGEKGGALMIIDIDHFKEINDQYGHSVGDNVLAQIGRQMKIVFCKDIYGRLGGDEFIVFMMGGRTRKKWDEKVKEIQSAFKMIEVVPEVQGITASIGVAVRTDESRFDELYQKADCLLYEVKRDGRNGSRIE